MFFLDSDTAQNSLVFWRSSNRKGRVGDVRKTVEKLAAELRIFVEVGQVRRSLVLEQFVFWNLLLLPTLDFVFFLLETKLFFPRLFHISDTFFGILDLVFECLPIKRLTFILFVDSKGLEIYCFARSDSLLQRSLEFLILRLQLPYHFILNTFVYNCFIYDFLSPICISESTKRFFIVDACWTYSANHYSFWVTSQGILKNSCQAGISVGHNSCLSLAHCFVGKNTDAVSENCKRFIDGTTFFESLTFCSCLSSFLRTRKIHQINNWELLKLSSIDHSNLLKFNSNNSVCSTWSLIHLSGTNWSARIALLHFFCNHFIRVNCVFAQALNVYFTLVFTHFKAA